MAELAAAVRAKRAGADVGRASHLRDFRFRALKRWAADDGGLTERISLAQVPWFECAVAGVHRDLGVVAWGLWSPDPVGVGVMAWLVLPGASVRAVTAGAERWIADADADHALIIQAGVSDRSLELRVTLTADDGTEDEEQVWLPKPDAQPGVETMQLSALDVLVTRALQSLRGDDAEYAAALMRLALGDSGVTDIAPEDYAVAEPEERGDLAGLGRAIDAANRPMT